MGCIHSSESKKNVVHPEVETGTEVETGKVINVAEDECIEDASLSKAQIKLVQNTWGIVREDLDNNGTIFYKRLFSEYPEVLSMFSFGSDVDVNQIKQDERVIKQAKRLMNMVGNAVDGLDDIPNLVPVLRDLGETHLRYGVKEHHYKPVGETLLWTLEKGLGDKFTPEVKGAWTNVYDLISETMKAGAADQQDTVKTDEVPLTKRQIQLAQENWSFVRNDWKKHGLTFYKRLFSSHPEVLELFSFSRQNGNLDDNEQAINQAGRLMSMIGRAVDNLDDIPGLVPVLEELGVRHIQYGVKDEHYDPVGESLIWTLNEGLEDQFTDEAKQAWIKIYGLVAESMKRGAKNAQSGD